MALSAQAYIRSVTSTGSPLSRSDAASIQVLVNGSLAAGQTNADGKVVITATSNPVQAVVNAAAAWSRISTSTVAFAPPAPTTVSNDPNDHKYVVTIEDTPANRSVVGGALAVTLMSFTQNGTILDSDIIVNPNNLSNGQVQPFSTDHAQGTIDLQSVLTHEMGHSLGADHSPVISATMFYAVPSCSSATSVAECTLHQTVVADDIAFATAAYPASNASAQLGSITGTVALASGTTVPGALVIAVDPIKGTTIGGLASLTDGSYTLSPVPPGSYQVYAQPLNGPTTSANLGTPNIGAANVNFRTTFAGGNAAPSNVLVTAGGVSSASISVDPATPNLQIQYFGTGSASGATVGGGAKAAASGSSADLLIWGPGLGSNVTASQIRILGPGVTVRPSSVRVDSSFVVNGLVPVRFTVDIASVSAPTLATVMVVNGTDAAAWTGGLVLLGAAPVITEVDNAFSNIPNSPIQSGTWVAIKGSNLSITSPGRGWNANESFPTSMDGTSVTINNQPAFVYFISPTQVNVQAPTDTTVGPVSVVLTNNGVSSPAATANYQTNSPALLQWGGGQYPYALITDGGTYIGKASVVPGTVSAHAGESLTLWVTGLGPTNPAVPAGQQPTTFPPPTTTPTVTVNGANVTVLGAVLRFAGLYQVNIQLPASMPAGDLPIKIIQGSFQSPNGIMINVQ
jgi:uncharacterized protein (TIGR03437 family)